MTKFFLIIACVISILGCAREPSLRDYQVRSNDEQQIVKIISEFENAANAYDAERLYSLYASNATIQTSTKKGSLIWEVFDREEWFKIIKRRIRESYQGSGLHFSFFSPKKFEVGNNEAQVTIPYSLVSTKMGYYETGLFKFELRKEISSWAITKFRYEILTSNGPDWPEYKDWIKRQK